MVPRNVFAGIALFVADLKEKLKQLHQVIRI